LDVRKLFSADSSLNPGVAGEQPFDGHGQFPEENVEKVFTRKKGEFGTLAESQKASGLTDRRVFGRKIHGPVQVFERLDPEPVIKIDLAEIDQEIRLIRLLPQGLRAPFESPVKAVKAPVRTGCGKAVKRTYLKTGAGPQRLGLEERDRLPEGPLFQICFSLLTKFPHIHDPVLLLLGQVQRFKDSRGPGVKDSSEILKHKQNLQRKTLEPLNPRCLSVAAFADGNYKKSGTR